MGHPLFFLNIKLCLFITLFLYSFPGLTLINFPKKIDNWDESSSDDDLIKELMDFMYSLQLKIAYIVRQSNVSKEATSEP